MFRVLIIDDEPIVREGLKSVIEWEELGFTVCGDGADGNDGLNKILQLKPDLTMIDIKMPGLYGIQVIEQAQEQGYKGKFIILTGYSDFKDAQSAVRLGIHSFLLKPIDENELVESLIKLKKNISAEYEARIYLNQNLKTVKESIITDILCSKGEHLHKDDYMRLYGLDMNYQVYQVAIIKSVRGDDYRQEVIKTFFSCEKDIDPVTIGEIVVLVLKGNSKLRLNEMLNLLPKTVLINDDIQIFTGVGRAVIDLKDIPISYQDAKKVINRRFIYQEKENIIYWDDIKAYINENGEKKSIDLFPYLDKIYTCIEISDIEKLDAVLTELELNCRQIDIQPERITAIFLNIFLKLKVSIVASYHDIKSTLPDDKEIMNSIYSESTLHGIINYFKAEFANVSKNISNLSSENVIKRLLTYIQKNYYKDLKLEKLAEIFGYNSAYLGKIFKCGAGEAFNTYLDKVRIENAKTLLMDNNLKVYEISKQVGYKNIDYFYLKFKAYVGMSPKEYLRCNGAPQMK